jgi:hypothetical protein
LPISPPVLLLLINQIKILSGRSIALCGAKTINGVPAFGLPNISNLVGRISIPTFSASPLWSINANRVTPFA